MQNIMCSSYMRKKDKETELLKKARKGDAESFEILILNHKEYLYKIAYSYVKDKDKALDIVQEATCKAWVNIHTLRKSAVFKSWITKIILNTSLNYIKKESKIIFLDEDNPLIVPEEDITIEEKLDLYNAIDLLKPKYKTVIILKYFDDMKIDDISDVLDLPINTVKSQLKRARQSLSNILKVGDLDE